MRSLSRLQVIIILLTRQRHGSSLVHLLPVLLEESLIDNGGGRGKSRGSDELL